MRVQADSEGYVVSRHLPPVEMSSLLTFDSKNRVIAREKIKIPLDDFNVPRPLEYLSELTKTLHSNYVMPPDRNVHHLAYPRPLYSQYGHKSVQRRYRESTSLMVDIPVQLHNYGHWVTEDPPVPSYETMYLRAKEQDQIDRLFKIGKAIISAPRWLDQMNGDGQQRYHTAVRYADEYMSENQFYDFLDTCDDSMVGLMPDRNELAQLGISEATRKLGTLSAARALCLSRESQDLIRRAT